MEFVEDLVHDGALVNADYPALREKWLGTKVKLTIDRETPMGYPLPKGTKGTISEIGCLENGVTWMVFMTWLGFRCWVGPHDIKERRF